MRQIPALLLLLIAATSVCAAPVNAPFEWTPEASNPGCTLTMHAIYDPDHEPAKGYKLAYFLNGGAWTRTSALPESSAVATQLAAAGYLLFSSEYRVIPSNRPDPPCGQHVSRDVQYQDAVAGFSKAFQWNGTYALSNGTTVKVDRGHGWLLGGYSAGAHLAMKINRDGNDFLRNYVRAVFSIAGPLSFWHHWSFDNNVDVPRYTNNTRRRMHLGDSYSVDLPNSGTLGGYLVLQQYYAGKINYDCDFGTVGVRPTGADCYTNNVQDAAGDDFILDNTYSSFDDKAAPFYVLSGTNDLLIPPEATLAICEWQANLVNVEFVPATETGPSQTIPWQGSYRGDCGTTGSRYALLIGGQHPMNLSDLSIMTDVIAWADSAERDL